jgi:thioredoxin reductase (NADPH)
MLMEAVSTIVSSRGVLAVGDVRSGSIKRVGAAIGEGAAVVVQLRAYLATTRTASVEAPSQARSS